MESGRAIRVGILCEGAGLQEWQLRCLEEVKKLPFVSIDAIVVNAASSSALETSVLTRGLKTFRSGLLLWRLYERAMLRRKSIAVQSKSIPAFPDALELRCAPIQIGRFRQQFDDQTIKSLKKLDLDVLIRFGFGILTGEILSIARHGLWSYHHGDPEHFRGAPPGFWEIHDRSAVSGVVLQRLTETLDGGLILRKGWFKTVPTSYPKSLDRLLFGAATFIGQALTELHSRGRLHPAPPAKLGSIYRYPKNGAMILFFARVITASIAEQLRSLFAHQQWSIGEVPLPIDEFFEKTKSGNNSAHQISWLAEQRGKFFADPFSLPNQDGSREVRLLAEEFDWRRGVGQIVELTVPINGRPRQPFETRSAIRSKWHLSYPYVFENEAKLYCLPECSESNSVRLYQWTSEAGEWEEGPVLLPGTAAVDPTLFWYNGRFWLFCTSEEAGGNEMLHAWYADELGSVWTAHALNPIKIDVRSARPAGRPFKCGEDLIRPSQDCSTGYGAGISFNRIVALSPDEFREDTIAVLRPAPTGRYRSGLHTISAAGDRTIIDGARMIFVPAQMRRALAKKLRRAWSSSR